MLINRRLIFRLLEKCLHFVCIARFIALKSKGLILDLQTTVLFIGGDYPRVYSPTFARMLAAIHADGRNQ